MMKLKLSNSPMTLRKYRIKGFQINKESVGFFIKLKSGYKNFTINAMSCL